MAEDNQNAADKTEKQILQERCRLMGIPFANATGVDKLKELIGAKMAGETAEVETINAAEKTKANALDIPEVVNTMSPAEKMIAEQTRLVRLRITNMDPKKRDLPGEVLTVANEIMGTIRKFIPFGEVTDGGYHVPYCLYVMMRDRKFLDIQTKTNKLTKKIEISQRWVREFSLDILDPLTQEELDTLKTAQLASGSIQDGDDD